MSHTDTADSLFTIVDNISTPDFIKLLKVFNRPSGHPFKLTLKRVTSMGLTIAISNNSIVGML